MVDKLETIQTNVTDNKKKEELVIDKNITQEDVKTTLLNAINNFGKELTYLSEDLKAIEVVTAVGTTTVDIKSGATADVTNLANSNDKLDISSKLTVLARTRLELDGDLLVVLPTKKSINISSKSENKVEPANNLKDNEPIQIDTEILNLHKENVNMALQNLQFVYGKILDIASKFAESGGKGNFLNHFMGK